MGAAYEPMAYRESAYEETVYNPYAEDYEPGYAGFGIYASGDAVRKLQVWLNQVVLRHTADKLKVDGLYGPKTAQAVRRLQHFLNLTKRVGLREDGLYGCRTYKAVLRYYREFGWPPPPPPIPRWAAGCSKVSAPTPMPAPIPQKGEGQSQKTQQRQQQKRLPRIKVQPQEDKIFGLDKRIVYIGGAVLVGLMIVLMLNREE